MELYRKSLACADYFWSLLRHKWFVYQAGRGFVSTWRLVKHDASKFLPAEFIPYAMHYYGEKHGIPKNKPAYKAAVVLHKSRNDHHFEYWADYDETGSFSIQSIPDMQMREMVADWFGARRAYNGKWPTSFYTWEWYQDEGVKVMMAMNKYDAMKLYTYIAERMKHLNEDYSDGI